MAKALIIVDVQNDFVEGGSLAVKGGFDLAENLAKLMPKFSEEYDIIVSSFDWHIEPGEHFSDNPDYVRTWPVHCVAHSEGAAQVGVLNTALNSVGAQKLYIEKGMYGDAYSAFAGTVIGHGNTPVSQVLAKLGVGSVDICGIALDYCVGETAKDAKKAGFDTTVLLDLTVGINQGRMDTLVTETFPKMGVAVRDYNA